MKGGPRKERKKRRGFIELGDDLFVHTDTRCLECCVQAVVALRGGGVPYAAPCHRPVALGTAGQEQVIVPRRGSQTRCNGTLRPGKPEISCWSLGSCIARELPGRCSHASGGTEGHRQLLPELCVARGHQQALLLTASAVRVSSAGQVIQCPASGD